MLNPLDLTGKLVLVTGASSGIGRGTAVVLSRLGARLILSGRRQEALEETRQMTERQEQHTLEPFDLLQINAIPAWVKAVVERAGGPLHGLVHSAGMGLTVPIRAFDERILDSVFVPNLHASLALLKGASAKGVVAPEGASLVWISSTAALVGQPGLVAYSASKGALISAVRGAALELAPKRIRVNTVAPGYVNTPMLEQARDSSPDGLQGILDKHALGIGEPEDVGMAVAFLLSDAARWVTGSTMVVDGGYSL